MDTVKCAQLKEKLAEQPAPQLVTIAQFFDGNDDPASIGPNVIDYPGVAAYRDTLTQINARADVDAVYAQIAELDPRVDEWPFTDAIFIVGTLAVTEAQQLLAHLQPDLVARAEPEHIPAALAQKHTAPVLIVWWD